MIQGYELEKKNNCMKTESFNQLHHDNKMTIGQKHSVIDGNKS